MRDLELSSPLHPQMKSRSRAWRGAASKIFSTRGSRPIARRRCSLRRQVSVASRSTCHTLIIPLAPLLPMPTSWGQSEAMRRLLNGGRSPSRSRSPSNHRADKRRFGDDELPPAHRRQRETFTRDDEDRRGRDRPTQSSIQRAVRPIYNARREFDEGGYFRRRDDDYDDRRHRDRRREDDDYYDRRERRRDYDRRSRDRYDRRDRDRRREEDDDRFERRERDRRDRRGSVSPPPPANRDAGGPPRDVEPPRPPPPPPTSSEPPAPAPPSESS